MGLSCDLPFPLFAAPVCTPPHLHVAVTRGLVIATGIGGFPVVSSLFFRGMAAQGWKSVPACEPATP